MSEYNKYVLAVNKIFEVLGKMKVGWTDKDNISYIASIEEYRQVVINAANQFSNQKENNNFTEQPVMEKLGNVEDLK